MKHRTLLLGCLGGILCVQLVACSPKQTRTPRENSRTVCGQLLPQGRAYKQACHEFPGKDQVNGVIFDVDGTLLDSLWAWEHSGSNFVRSLGIEPAEDLDEQLVPLSLMDGARLIKERYQLTQTPEEILAQTLVPIVQRYAYEIAPMPGIPQLLARLQAQGVKMSVATAGDKAMAVSALKRLGLLDYFETIVTCDEVGIGKTSPAVYEEALRRMGTNKTRTLVVEDAPHALQTAHAAGFLTAAVEEEHSAAQRADKMAVADFYIFSYEGNNVLYK